ncbi:MULTISPECIES: carboxy terminal-processing peptidase [Sedimenticola]|uniref:carboxy terminal-processing peptidase n=1 Tax=Sedimenticola TaxID=349742 RepID=UPI0004B93BD5|nr:MULTISPECIES: carboxy terminal-processing peptidase [Sedimenticola]MCW8903079.1 carboxy terminal-processing peptidase [Sedimenticola sp.]
MKFRYLLFWALLLLQCFTLAWASVREVPLDELQPTRAQRQSTLIILKVINEYHYKKHLLDDEMSRAILSRYLEVLDPNKSFFIQGDIDRFNVIGDRLDDDLKDARLDSAFSIFRVYRQRIDERIEYALKLLDRDYDFTINENYRFDRQKSPWTADTAELNELWRKKVKSDILSLKLKDKPLDEIKSTLQKRYTGIQRRTRQMDSDDVFQVFINSYTLSLEPHTSYMSPRVSENFDISMRLSLEGIGAVLKNENEYTVVQRTVVGGPAALSGQINPGDRIVGVGQDAEGEMEDVIGWRLQDVVDLIRGAKGTTVRLQLLPEDEGSTGRSKLVTLVRNEIKLEDQAAKKFVIKDLGGMGNIRIGVIDIPAFYRDFQGYSKGDKDFTSTTRDVRRLISELEEEGVDGIVIDLRENGGGSLVEATELTGLFIPSGPVVQVKNASGDLDIENDPDPDQVYTGPLAVLVDRHSASASEIFAGAIQDYHRGIIIGEPTFGKGTVQTLVDLGRFVRYGEKNLGRLRLTMAQFFRVNGGSTQFKGVVPDIVYPSAVQSDDQGERSLDNSLPWAKIDAVNYKAQGLGLLEPYRQMHQLRIKDDPGFIYLTQVEAMLKEVKAQDTVSLLEKDREIEWDQREKRRKAEKNRFLVAVGLDPEPEDVDENKERTDPAADQDDPVARIMLNEAAHILADYIGGQSRAAMVN